MAGEEYARIHSWGHAPDRKGEYERASPCSHCDLPQTLLEPILVRHAVHNGFTTHFNSTFLSFAENEDTGLITATVRDNVSGLTYQVRCKYLFGADGARSPVAKQLGLPLIAKASGGPSVNVLVRADLSHLMEHRRGNLHWIVQPDRRHPIFAPVGVVRMVKPWHEWLLSFFPNPGSDFQVQPSHEDYLNHVKRFIGDDTPAEILDISKWVINEIAAEKYSRGNIFCLGDAVHRHPPTNGLGSNTCIQDAFNLAWKVAFVHRGIAAPSLLSTYSIERQPVGLTVVERANSALRENFPVWGALGALSEDMDAGQKIQDDLRAATAEGQKQRRALQEAVKQTAHEFLAIGVEMGQVYSGPGIYLADESEPYKRSGRAAEDEVLYYEPSTYPGCRLPHVWLNRAVPTKPTSTIDLAGHGAFSLLTGIGGESWRSAAGKVALELAIPIHVHSVGFRQDWEDVYFDWDRLRGVEESGAVLVRPDRFVAWRTPVVLEDENACYVKLAKVLRTIMGHESG